MKIKKYILLILFYGALWGLLELLLGGYLHLIHHPLKGKIMQSIGYIILGICAVKNKSPFILLGVGIVTACFKTFDVFIFNVSIMSQGIVNPIISILQQAAIASVISFVIFKVINLVSIKLCYNKY